MKYLLAIFIGVLCVACSPNTDQDAIQKTDDLIAKLTTAGKDLSEFNPEDVKWLSDSINFDVKFIQQEYDDTLSLEDATKIDAYLRNVKSIRKFTAAYEAQQKELDYSLDQVNDIKADLMNGMIDSADFNVYYKQEEEAVNRVLKSNEDLIRWYEKINSNYTLFKPSVDSLVTAIKVKKGY